MGKTRQFPRVSFSILCLAILLVSVSGAKADGILGTDLNIFCSWSVNCDQYRRDDSYWRPWRISGSGNHWRVHHYC